VVEDIGPLGELVGLDQPLELGGVDEMIIDAVDFPGRFGRVVALIDIVMLSSASSSSRLIVDLPAPEGDERTTKRPRR